MGTQAEIAEKLGISDRWLRKLVADGVVAEAPRGDWDLGTVARQLLAYREAEIDRLKAEVASREAQLQRYDGAGSDGIVKAQEDARHRKLQADKLELDVKQMRGELVPADQIGEALNAAIVIMKTRVNAIPAKAAPLVGASNIAHAEKVIRAQVDEALGELGRIEVIAPAGA